MSRSISSIAVILLFFSMSAFASSDQVRVYVIDGGTIEELQASLDDNSTWKPAVIIEPTIDVERPFAERVSFQIARAFYDSGLLGLVSSVLPNNNSELDFTGAWNLRRYGAGNEYIQNLNNIYLESRKTFNVNSTLTIVEDSNNALGWTKINESGSGDINIALFNSQNYIFLDLKRLEDYTLYHELSHIAFQKEVGGVFDLGMTDYELRDAELFGEYGNDIYAQKTLPKEKMEKFMKVVKAEMERVDYENTRIAFELGEYGFLLRTKARTKEYGITKLDTYFDRALLYESPKFREKFLELADEFYERSHTLNKGNFEQNTRFIVEKIGELRNID